MGFFMKEKNLKVLLTVVIVILILLIVGLVGYNLLKNTMTMSKIEKNLDNLNIGSNYSYTMINVTTGNEGKYKDDLSVGQYYVDEGKFYARINTYGNDGNNTAIAYKDSTDDIILYDDGENKSYKINGESNSEIDMEINPTDLKAFSQEILSRIKDNVDNIVEETKNGKECYVITTKEFNKYWVEKDTGIVISYIENNNSFDLNYSIGNVTDNDFVKLNTDEYIQENN